MSFLEHLDELRKRLIWAIVALVGGFLVALYFIDAIFGFIMRPLAATLPAGRKMIYTEPTEAFMLQLKVAALAGVVLAAPAVMWQLWLFIAPGLYRKEKRLALPFIVSTSVLFVAGAAFNHYVVFPVAFTFLGGFSNDYMEFMPRISPVFSLYSQLLLAFGLIFQMPVIVFTLARLGLVTAGFLWRNTKYAILIIFVHLGGHHADERRRHSDADGRADDPALLREHRDRVVVRQEPAARAVRVVAADRRITPAQAVSSRVAFRGRSTVGQRPLKARIGVRIPAPEPLHFPSHCLHRPATARTRAHAVGAARSAMANRHLRPAVL